MSERKATIKRKTAETDITLTLNIDGDGVYHNDTGVPFFDHMLDLFSKHSLIDLNVSAKGDLAVDYHHTVEDVGLALGRALNEALATRAGIRRYGSSLIPMDEALCQVAIDLGGRPYLVYELTTRKRKIRDFDVQLIEEFFRALAVELRMNLHIHQAYGKDIHHAIESIFKGVARAMRVACERDPRVKGIPSSKGNI